MISVRIPLSLATSSPADVGLGSAVQLFVGLLIFGLALWIIDQVRGSRRRQWATEVACAVRARDSARLDQLRSSTQVNRWGPGLGDVLAEFSGLLDGDLVGKRRMVEANRVHRTRMEQAPAACVVLDPGGAILDVSDEACWLLGRSRKDLQDKSILEFLERADPMPRRYLRILDSLGGTATKSLYRTAASLGDPVILLALSRAVLDAEGVGREEILTLVDITALEAEQPRVPMGSKTMERFAGEVAQEFNDRLTAILGHAALLEEQSSDPSVRASAESIVNEVGQARDMTSQLLAWSRPRVRSREASEVNATLESGRLGMARVLPDRTQLDLLLGAEPVFVPITESRLRFVVEHLLRDVSTGQGSGGKVRVELLPLAGDLEGDSRAVRLRVSAHGPEGAAWDRSQRPELESVRALLAGGPGRVVVEDNARAHPIHEEPARCSVSLFLPVLENVDSKSAVEVESRRHSTGPATLCVVDDDEAVLCLLSTILRSAGYRVLQASSGVQALELYRDAEDPVDLLIADLGMRPMSGPDLVGALEERHGHLDVIYVSGSVDERSFDSDPARKVEFLQKPFRPRELIDRVAEILERTNRPRPQRLMVLESATHVELLESIEGLELGASMAKSVSHALELLADASVDLLIVSSSRCTQADRAALSRLVELYPDLPVFDLDSIKATSKPIASLRGLAGPGEKREGRGRAERVRRLQAALRDALRQGPTTQRSDLLRAG